MTMLNFDEGRFVASQVGAIAHGEALYDAVATHLHEGGDSLFFLGAGGAGIPVSYTHLTLPTILRV